MTPTDETTTEALLSVRDLSIRYGDKVALKGVTLEVRPHEIFGIIGPANSGKTISGSSSRRDLSFGGELPQK